jgi:uncharacterized protein YndB with AHSA1/START domain
MADLVATAETDINASTKQVWDALVDPKKIEKYMFGSTVTTDWKPGSKITWAGEYEGKKYEDKGEVLEVEPERKLKVTHFSPLSGQADAPENYHTLTYMLSEKSGRTHVKLSQDNNGSPDEVQSNTKNWNMMLTGLKKCVEGS